jgi:hypothetical protein
MTPEEYRAQLANAMTEDELLAAVLGTPRRPGLALAYGWMGYHTHRSQHSPAGFPDLCLVHPSAGLLKFAELKRERRGKRDDPTPAQVEWLDALESVERAAVYLDTYREAEAPTYGASPPIVEVHLWRPSDLLDGSIEAILRVSQ